MSDRFTPGEGPTTSDIDKSFGRMSKEYGGTWQRVDPQPVSVRRTSGAVETDWFVIAYDQQRQLYGTRKADGTIKPVPVADLWKLNGNLSLSEREAETENPGATKEINALREERRGAIAALKVDEQMYDVLVSKFHAAAQGFAEGLDRARPDLGLRLLEEMQAVVGDHFDPDPKEAARQFAAARESAGVLRAMTAIVTTLNPAIESYLSKNLAMARLGANVPALGKELEWKLIEAVLEKAYARKMRGK